MKQIERIKQMLLELQNDGACYCLSKERKSYFLIYKDNRNSKATYHSGLREIETFLIDKCCDLDSRTGIIC